MGIAALVLGILAVVFAVFPLITYWGAVILGIIVIVLCALGEKKGAKNATAGLVLAIIGTSIAGLMLIACGLCAAAVSSAL